MALPEEVRHAHLELRIAKLSRHSERALRIIDGALALADLVMIVPDEPDGATQTPTSADAVGQPCGLVEDREDPGELGEWEQRGAEIEAEVDGLLRRLAILGQMRKSGQGLVEKGHRFSVSRARCRLLAGLAQVALRFV